MSQPKHKMLTVILIGGPAHLEKLQVPEAWQTILIDAGGKASTYTKRQVGEEGKRVWNLWAHQELPDEEVVPLIFNYFAGARS